MSEALFNRHLMSLPDNAFFDLYRTYLGPVSTPFRKQELCQDLSTFFQRTDVQQRIVQLIDDDDSYWLTVIDISTSFTLDRAQQIFAGRLSPVEIHQYILNLEDRMLIIMDPESRNIQLNPILRPLLQTHAVNLTRILPVSPAPSSGRSCPMDDAAWFSFYCYFRYPQQISKLHGGIKKKDMDSLTSVFFRFPEKGVLGNAVESIIHAMTAIGLLDAGTADGTTFVSSRPAWERFLQLGRSERLSYLAAGMIVPDHRYLEDTARGCQAFLSLLQPSGRYLVADILSALQFAFSASNGPSANWTADLYRALCSLGVLWPEGKEHCLSTEDLISDDTASGSPGNSPDISLDGSIVLQPSFEVTITHNAPIGGILPLAAVLEPRRCDIYPQFELSRDRCLIAFIHEPEAIELLSRCSKGVLPQNIAMSLELWETEGRSLSLYSGTILKADEQRRHIIEHHQSISRLIQETLAPGVYLMRGTQQEVQAAFADAGLGNIPSRSKARTPAGTVQQLRPLPKAVFQHLAPPGGQQNLPNERHTLNIEEIHTRIPDEDAREVMEHLLEQKLILLPEQISSTHLPKERNEARGIDYMGKVRLLERILRSPSDLAEITERDRNGKPLRRLIRPTALKPRGGDLYLSGLQLPGGEPIHMQVRKLSLVRKVRSGFNSASHN